MSHPLSGSVVGRVVLGVLVVAGGTVLFGAGMWVGGASLPRSAAIVEPGSHDCDCDADDQDDADDAADDDADDQNDADVEADVEADNDADADAQADAEDAASLYSRAQDEYVHGHYRQAIALSRADSDPRKWRVIGAASCFLHDRKTAGEAFAHLDAQGRQFLRYVCSRNKLTLP